MLGGGWFMRGGRRARREVVLWILYDRGGSLYVDDDDGYM